MDATILSRLQAHASQMPDKPVYTYLERGETIGRTCSFAELHAKVEAIAHALCAHGYQGERAMLLYANPLDFIEVFLGCLAAGITAVPLAVPSVKNIDSIIPIANNAGIRCVLSGRREQQQLQAALTAKLGNIPWHCIGDAVTDGSQVRYQRIGENAGRNPIAFLQYTSGSTGTPKGVMVSHRNLMANEAVISRAMRIHRDSVVVGWLPHYHDMGLIGNLLQPLYQGAQCVLMQPVDFIQKPIRWLRALSSFGGTVSGGPNFAYDLCVTRTTAAEREGLDLRRLEVAFTGAEPVKSATIERFLAAYSPYGLRHSAIFPCYGMAESTLFITGVEQGSTPAETCLRADAIEVGKPVQLAGPASPSASKFVSCGHPYGDTLVAIADPDSGQRLPPGCVGEIWVHGDSVAEGYFGQSEASARIFGAAFTEAPAIRYLRTGDLGVLLDGQLYIVGRLKDLLIVRGCNYAPEDIESTAQQASATLTPGAGAVFQCTGSHDARLVLVQELSRQGARQSQPELEQVVELIKTAVIARHSIVLHEVVLIKPGQLPRTTSGKVRRNTCRELFESGGFSPREPVELAEA